MDFDFLGSHRLRYSNQEMVWWGSVAALTVHERFLVLKALGRERYGVFYWNLKFLILTIGIDNDDEKGHENITD